MCEVETGSCIYFPVTVAQEAQGGGEAEQQGWRSVCVLWEIWGISSEVAPGRK